MMIDSNTDDRRTVTVIEEEDQVIVEVASEEAKHAALGRRLGMITLTLPGHRRGITLERIITTGLSALLPNSQMTLPMLVKHIRRELTVYFAQLFDENARLQRDLDQAQRRIRELERRRGWSYQELTLLKTLTHYGLKVEEAAKFYQCSIDEVRAALASMRTPPKINPKAPASTVVVKKPAARALNLD